MTEVVAALIWDNDKFMICQRPAHKARGLLWEFVGGKVEPGETKEQHEELMEFVDEMIKLLYANVWKNLRLHFPSAMCLWMLSMNIPILRCI